MVKKCDLLATRHAPNLPFRCLDLIGFGLSTLHILKSFMQILYKDLLTTQAKTNASGPIGPAALSTVESHRLRQGTRHLSTPKSRELCVRY